MNELITVGVPVYNLAETLRRTVESLINQTVVPDIIHISDNASTDATEEVGRALESEYACVSYTRHKSNLGGAGNFLFLLQAAKTPFFMWLAADDWVLPTFIEKTLACLRTYPDVTTCVSKVLFVDHQLLESIAVGTYPLMEDVQSNLARYIDNASDNCRVYGLHRTCALMKSFPKGKHFHALDWAIMAGTLLYGKHAEIPEILMVRDLTPGISYVYQVRQDNKSFFSRLFPLFPFTLDLIFRQRIPLNISIFYAFLKINIQLHYIYIREFHPIYFKFFGRFLWEKFGVYLSLNIDK